MSYPPYSPFPEPVTPPATDPAGGDDLHIVCFDRLWLPVVLTCLRSMVDPSSWAGDTAAVKLATRRANDLLAEFMLGCSAMPDFDPCCEETNDLLTDLLGVSGRIDSTLSSLLDCCKSLSSAAAMQVDVLRDDFGGDDPENPASVDPEVPDTTYSSDSADPPEVLPRRLEALCATIDEVTAWAWAKAYDEYRLLFNLIDLVIPFVKEIPGAWIELAEEFLLEVSGDAFEDEDAQQTIRCCMYEAMKDQDTTSVIAFQASLSGCDYPWLSHENMLKQIVVAFLSDPRNWHAFHRLYVKNFKRSKHDAYMTTAPCLCRGNCWDWEDGDSMGWLPTQHTLFANQEIEPENFQLFDDLPGAVAGWAIGSWGEGSDLGAFIRLTALVDITHVTARFWASGTSIGRPWAIRAWGDDKDYIGQISGTLSGGEGWYDVSQTPAGLQQVRYISVHTESGFRTAIDVLKLNSTGIVPCGPT